MTMKRYALSLVLAIAMPFVASAQNNLFLQKLVAANSTPPPLIENVVAGESQAASFGKVISHAKALSSSKAMPLQFLEGSLDREVSTLNAEKWSRGEFATVASRTKSVNAKSSAIAPLGGYIAKDFSTRGNYNSAMTLFKDDAGAYKMANVYGLKDTISVNIDLANGTVEIPAQKLYVHSTYGDVYIYPVNFNTMQYNPEKPITGTIDDKGVITLSSWGIFVAEGQYAGSCFNAFENSSWIPANATIKNVDTEGKTESYSSLIEQTSDNEILIYNFAGNGVAVSAIINSAKTVKISPQLILSNLMYGDFYCYPADFSAKRVYTKMPIVGTGSDNGINFGGWVVAQRDNPSGLLLGNTSTEITTSFKISYPAEIEISFKGEGTESSPYQISSANDLMMLSQAVSQGNSYKGIFFKLTQDVSLGKITAQYQPIGDAAATFEGTFDGDGHSINDMNINRGGFSDSGVFGYIGKNGVVKNLNVKNGYVKATGANVGILAGSNYGSIENCHVMVSVISAESNIVGGVVGYSEGRISGCSFDGSISNTGDTGGIAGYNLGTISTCYSTAQLVLSGYYSSIYHCVGGIAGSASPNTEFNCVISDSYYMGQIVDANGVGILGGLVGALINGKVQRCFSVGAITSAEDKVEGTATGGLFGMMNEAEVYDCYNAGSVTKASAKNESVGGIVGYLSLTYTNGEPTKLSTIKNCYNSGLVNATAVHAKSGMYGTTFELNGIKPADGMFTNCYNDSQMTGLDGGGIYGISTAELISGILPDGFSADVWSAKKGLYPTLKNVSGNVAAELSASCVALADGETMRKVKKAFTVNTPSSDIKWQLYDSKNKTYVTATDALTMAGNTVSIKDIYSTEIIAASTADGTGMKLYLLDIVPKVFEGEGTEASPYLINDVADFQKLNSAVETHRQSHEGDFFKMTADIDFAGSKFAGVSGKSTSAFGGVFDGDNHFIHNLEITSSGFDESGKATTEGSYYYAGLFGVCTEKSVIKNINMASDNKFTFYGYSAPIVAYTSGKVENCRNYADVSGIYQYVAGVVGTARPTATVANCYNAGNVKAGNQGAGGVVAVNYGEVKLSQNDGAVEATFVNSLTAEGTQNTAGGIAAYNLGTIDRCVNNAAVSAYKRVGGIIGINSASYEQGNVTNTINNGIVTCNTDDADRGAIIGYMIGKGTVTDNYYDASVTPYGAANNATINGVTAVSTSTLIAGIALSGLNSDDWIFKTGEYPVLKAFENEEASVALRKINVAFADGESKSNVVKNTALAKDSKIVWTLKQNKNFTIADNALNVTVPTDMTVAADTLTAMYDGKYSKVYFLRSVPSILDGAGTVQDPFQIRSVDDMNKLADFMTSASMEYDGYYFKLMNDIDYAGETVKILSMGNVNFQGDFDGNGKTIKGYKFEDKTTKTGRYVGLFANVGGGGVVHDLTLEGSFNGHSYIGAFVGKLYGTLRNCVNRTTVEAVTGGYAGGFVNRAYEGSLIENCVNEGSIKTKTTYCGGIASQADKGCVITGSSNKGSVNATTGYAAGIVANNNAKIQNSYNTGTIEGKQYLAGIVAKGGVTDSIINSYNTANITVSANTYAAGIVASSTASGKAYIHNCYNTGDISAQSYVGGIAGLIATGCEVSDCYNTGAITSNKSSYTGGLFGSASGKSATYPTVITNSYNTGAVKSVAGYTGGLTGNSSDITMTGCYNLGDVEVKATAKALGVGGIGGGLSGVITNCWNYGNVSSTSYGTGGLGGIGSGEIHSCANYGNVTGGDLGNNGNYGNAGGLWGYGASKIYDSFNMGAVTAPGHLSGINGGAFSEAVISNCYNAGALKNTSESTEMCSNIVSYSMSGNSDNVTVSNCYYDSDINPVKLENESLVTALPTQQMFAVALGNNFDYHHAAYPTIPAFAENALLNCKAANIEFTSNDDNANAVTSPLYVAEFGGVAVSASENIELADGLATPKSVGNGWIRYTAKEYGIELEKEYPVVITKVSGMSDLLDNGKIVEARLFYDLNGIEIANPEAGKFYIVKTKYSDGSESVNKVLLKD